MRRLAITGLALAGAAGIAVWAQPCVAHAAPLEAEAVRTDHHVHVHSPEIAAFLPEYCASPGRIGPCDPAFVAPHSVEDLLEDMDNAGVEQAWLMSTGYLAESPMMIPARPDAAALVHAANAFTVELARSHPGRLVAYIGVNPNTPTALSEVAAWRGDPFARGVKIHLTNSSLDLRDPVQAANLAAVFRAASEAGMAIMIHMRTRAADYGGQDVRIFLDDVLPAAADAQVMIAHAGGWGGLDEPTWEAMETFAAALEQQPGAYPNLSFDLAQTFDSDTTPRDAERLVGIMRRIGMDRYVMGSDWPFSGALANYFGPTFSRLPLTFQEQLILKRAR